MNKTCTLEQAKRLKELGVTQASERYWMQNDTKTEWVPHIILLPIERYNNPHFSAFNTGELLAMMPDDCQLIKISESDFYCELRHSLSGFSKKHTHATHALADFIIKFFDGMEGLYKEEINERIKQYHEK